MKYSQPDSTQGMPSKVLVFMVAGLASTLTLSGVMVSLVVKWFTHS